MREIKFRAWDKERKKMRYQDEEFFYVGRRRGKCGNEFYKRLSMSIDNFYTPEQGKLMQYIGLKDKNGKEIYEGDILKREDSLVTDDGTYWLAEVIYLNGPNHSGFQLAYHHKEEAYKGISGYFQIDILEIIGNIYEDPELINAN